MTLSKNVAAAKLYFPRSCITKLYFWLDRYSVFEGPSGTLDFWDLRNGGSWIFKKLFLQTLNVKRFKSISIGTLRCTTQQA